MRVKLIDPNGDKIVPILADYGLPVRVPQGSVIEVPDELAGRGPAWREPTDEDYAHGPRHWDHVHKRRIGDGPVEIEDLGEGLLAQTTIWEAVAE
jgi:hypothetical protein